MPTARELLEQADALMRRNRERALEAERAALRLSTGLPEEPLPRPPEAATPTDAPADQPVIAFVPTAITDTEKAPPMVERAREDLHQPVEQPDAVVPAEAVVESDQPAPEIPELTDIVTIGAPWPLPHEVDEAPVEDVPLADVPGPVEVLDARDGEAPVEKETPEEPIDDALVYPQAVAEAFDRGEAREETLGHEAAAVESSEREQVTEDIADREQPSVDTPPCEASEDVAHELSEPAAAVASDSSALEAAVPVVASSEEPNASATEGATAEAVPCEELIETLATPANVESAGPAATAIPLAAESAPATTPADKEPWRLWSLFSFGRRPSEAPPAPAVVPAVTESDVATVPPLGATGALAELPVEAPAPPEEVPLESKPTGPAPEPATVPSVESAVDGVTAGAAVAAPDDGVLPLPEAPFTEAATPGPDTFPDALQDNERWNALAEEIRMQVLQRIDIFTDTQLRDQLGVQLQPIVQRASAELVTTINEHVGKLIRAYIAEAIEREIDTWRRNNP